MEENIPPFTDNIAMDINADADIPGNTHLSNPESGDDPEPDKLTSELQEQKEKYLRLAAEFENYKRRTAREKIELSQTAGKEIISSLLDILDDAERAEKQMQNAEDIVQVKEGVLLVFNKLKNILQHKGLTAMETVGDGFDVEKHEAIAESDGGSKMKGKVIDTVQKGYYLNNKLLRFAKVVVGK